MKDSMLLVESKLKTQVDHIFNIKNEDALKSKVFELAYEWYMKGIKTGFEFEREDKDE